MTDLVPPDQIEQIVGASRHPTRHLGRAVSAEQVFYILHSQDCQTVTSNLRDCPFSLALDNGVDFPVADQTLKLTVRNGRLIGWRNVA